MTHETVEAALKRGITIQHIPRGKSGYDPITGLSVSKQKAYEQRAFKKGEKK